MIMPVLYRYGAYCVYFWSDECTPREEVHIHISEGKPTKDADKFWLTKSGYFVPDKHNSKLQRRICTKILENLSNQEFIDVLEGKWFSMFGELKYKQI